LTGINWIKETGKKSVLLIQFHGIPLSFIRGIPLLMSCWFGESIVIPIKLMNFPFTRGEIRGVMDISETLQFAFRKDYEIHGCGYNYLSVNEIQNLIVKLYHALYDFARMPEISGKSYAWIMEHPYLYLSNSNEICIYFIFLDDIVDSIEFSP
jgi:hypothetical protein